MKRQFAVIGLGRFGASLSKTLVAHGHEVMAIDSDYDKVQDAISDRVATHAVQLDATDEDALLAVGIKNFDTVIVAIGTHREDSILICLMLKDIGITNIIAKALDRKHGKVLEKIGVNRVIYPEIDMGVRIAHNLMSNTLDYFEIAPEYSIVDIKALDFMHNRTLSQLKLREKHRVTVLAIKRNKADVFVPVPAEVILPEDILVILGHNRDLEALYET